jgi:hypothetical protein
MDWLDRLKQKNETVSGHASEKVADVSPISRSEEPEIMAHLESFTVKGQDQSITANSEKLGRRITVSWPGDNPQLVFVDGLPFNLEEIGSLKQAKPTGSELEKVLLVKRLFGIKPD